ncbi:MAG TPA: SH3 domain-containing protein [Candidatus Binatia bacterium]|jgi:uncharacterized protein YgiM (DUF1202 family)
MTSLISRPSLWITILFLTCGLAACKAKDNVTNPQDLADINQQIRPFVATQSTPVRVGPGPQFRSIGQLRENSKVNVVGRDGDWLLIVSKVGNPPGYIDMNSVRAATGQEKESTTPVAEGKYEATADTYVRGGAGIGYPVLSNIKRGTIFDVVGEDSGWLKVESKHGNPPGYVEATAARPIDTAKR